MSFFNSLTDHLIDTSERLIKVVEEGSTILLGGTLSQPQDNDATTAGTASTQYSAPTGASPESMEGMDDLDGILSDELKEEYMNMDSPLNGIADGVLGDIMRNQATPTTIWEHMQAFKAAINWSEYFIISILSFHIAMAFLTFIILKHGEMKSRLSILVIISILVQCTQTFNTWASSNWEKFATQNYFDESGVFVTLVWSAPLLLITFVMLIAYLREASQLLIQVKTKELKKKSGGRLDPVTGKIIGGSNGNTVHNTTGSGSGTSTGATKGATKGKQDKKTNKNKRRGKKSPKED